MNRAVPHLVTPQIGPAPVQHPASPAGRASTTAREAGTPTRPVWCKPLLDRLLDNARLPMVRGWLPCQFRLRDTFSANKNHSNATYLDGMTDQGSEQAQRICDGVVLLANHYDVHISSSRLKEDLFRIRYAVPRA